MDINVLLEGRGEGTPLKVTMKTGGVLRGVIDIIEGHFFTLADYNDEKVTIDIEDVSLIEDDTDY